MAEVPARLMCHLHLSLVSQCKSHIMYNELYLGNSSDADIKLYSELIRCFVAYQLSTSAEAQNPDSHLVR